ncbi:MAG TPA: lipopolysaccharide biosynthesis protein [Tepidisphaeraceae bacterium]|nr:lipopolysaccharide biosynthesis protein [Tepidisphaeraceae bacterium]
MASGSRHLLSHAGIYLVARGVPGAMAFLAIPLFTRLLTPGDYGRYALVAAAAALINAMLFQWMRLSLVRYLPACQDDPVRLKSTIFTVSLLLVLGIGALGLLACLLPFARAWRPVILPCWAVLAAQAFFDLSCEYSRAAIRPWQYMGLQLVRSACTVGIGALLIVLGAGWWGPLGGLAFGMTLAVAYAFSRDWADVRLRIDRQMLRKISVYGVPLSLTVALTVVIGTCDRFLIAWKLGENAAGLYSVAIDFTCQTLTLLMLAINLSVFPIAVRAWERDGPGAAREQMKSNAALLLAVGVPCVVGLSVLSPGIANCFLGSGYREAAAHLMPMVALATFIAGLKAYHFDSAFQFAHRTIWQVWIVLAAAVANVALNLFAIPLFGINGSAGASVLAYGLAIGLTIWLGRRHFALPFPLRPCVQVALAAGAMALLLLPWRNHIGPLALAAQIAGGAGAYGVVLIACDFLDFRIHAASRLARVLPARNTRLTAGPAPVAFASLVEPK